MSRKVEKAPMPICPIAGFGTVEKVGTGAMLVGVDSRFSSNQRR